MLDILKGRNQSNKKRWCWYWKKSGKASGRWSLCQNTNWNKYSLKYLPCEATTITVGKSVPKWEDYMKSSGVSLPEMGEDISLPARWIGIRVNIPKPDIVKGTDTVHLGAEGQNCIIHNSPCSQQSCRNQKSVLQKMTKKEKVVYPKNFLHVLWLFKSTKSNHWI